MNPATNPFAPGAGTPPPELAGRDELLENMRVTLARVRAGRSAKSVLMIGLRGVGKTVLLDRMRDDAEAEGLHTLRMEAPRTFAARSSGSGTSSVVAAPVARGTCEDTRDTRVASLAGFARALKVKYQDIEVGIDYEPEPGLADNGISNRICRRSWRRPVPRRRKRARPSCCSWTSSSTWPKRSSPR